jgi:hypothetical protein
MISSLLVALLALSQNADPCAPIKAAKEKTYGFKPLDLKEDKEREAKSEAMDVFWELVETNGAQGTSCLRDLLNKEERDGFFLFDGTGLLLSVDPSPESISVAERSLERADISQVDPGGYINIVLLLSGKGVDVGRLARRYLELEKADAFIPAHALNVERWMGAVFLYGSMPPEKSDRYLIEALDSKSGETRGAAALALAITMTEPALKQLAAFKGLNDIPKTYQDHIAEMRMYEPYENPKTPLLFTREEVLKWIAMIPHTRQEFEEALVREEQYKKTAKGDPLHALEEDPPFLEIGGHTRFVDSAMATLNESDLPAIREARRLALHGVSDESLDEYFAFTAIIQGVMNRLDLYKEYRPR